LDRGFGRAPGSLVAAHRLHRPTPAETVERIEALRRQSLTGQQIARDLAISPATVSRVLRRLGLNRIAALEPAERCGATSGNARAN
jgi:hypothetical protein